MCYIIGNVFVAALQFLYVQFYSFLCHRNCLINIFAKSDAAGQRGNHYGVATFRLSMKFYFVRMQHFPNSKFPIPNPTFSPAILSPSAA